MITDWQEVWEGRGGSIDNKEATRTYNRTFRIVTDSMLDGPAQLLASTELLTLLTPYIDSNGLAADPNAIVNHVRCEQDQDNPFAWLVHCDFSSGKYDPQQKDGTQENPLLRPPIWTLGVARVQKPIDRDYLGNPIQNSAGTPFSPLPEIDDTRITLTCERNEAQPDWNLILSYQDAINSDVFCGFAAGTFKVSIGASAQFENNQYYWRVTYTFEGRNPVVIYDVVYSGWDIHLQDKGLFQLDDNTPPNLVPIYGVDGSPIAEPVLFNGAGRALENGVGGTVQAFYLHFRPYNWLPFEAFELPGSIT